MKRILLFITALSCLQEIATAQIPWRDSTTRSGDLSWSNYSTTYLEPAELNKPILVTAIPYNGIYEIDNTPLDLSFNGSLYRFQSTLSDKGRQLTTHDSAEVYFLATGIHPWNASNYEFRVVLDDGTVIVPWQTITAFTGDDFQLNAFDRKIGWLGGYKTTLGRSLAVLLRKKNDSTNLLSSAIVQWVPVKPVLHAVYTSRTFINYMNNARHFTSGKPAYTIDVPDKLVLENRESNTIFEVGANIYKREALEYQVVRNDEVYRAWGPNDNDNNFIWLKELPGGKYVLSIRYRAQRHNVITYPFKVKPAWYETTRFRLIAGGAGVILLACILLLIKVTRQRRKITLEQLKKAKLQMALQSVYAQLNPHFIFNALHSIQGLINKNDIAGANRYLGAFGNLMRDSLASNHNEVTALSQELSTLGTYLELEQLRFGFQYNIKVDDSINSYETEIPSLFLQPLVENAVKHGIGTLQEKGMISIRVTRHQKDMEAVIEDNGTGFDTSDVTNGHGLRLTRERAALLNDLQQDQRIDISLRSVPGKGTTVSLVFKNWLT
jgi:two-component system LytT family sensor kinase